MAVFSAQLTDKIKSLVGRYETKRSAILPILHAIQDEYHWIHEEHINALEKDYEFNRVQVKEVISFYDIYSSTPKKPFQIRFCNNITCHMMGSQQIVDHLKDQCERTGFENCEVTPYPCLGKCDGAPVMLINKTRYENVSLENVDGMVLKHVQTHQKKELR